MFRCNTFSHNHFVVLSCGSMYDLWVAIIMITSPSLLILILLLILIRYSTFSWAFILNSKTSQSHKSIILQQSATSMVTFSITKERIWHMGSFRRCVTSEKLDLIELRELYNECKVNIDDLKRNIAMIWQLIDKSRGDFACKAYRYYKDNEVNNTNSESFICEFYICRRR